MDPNNSWSTWRWTPPRDYRQPRAWQDRPTRPKNSPAANSSPDRAEARDFSDIYALSAIYDKQTLLTRAAEIDAGFDPQILATMFDTLQRFPDHAIPTAAAEIPQLRAFFAAWAQQLRH
ncbi:hypothetical protein R4282_31495 [Rhodococcus oxybenzonivorans]|uniref:hypothetical protein n=1 Tax=Rhodococcus oxybenzonivorans TaxID=1990687 RepID=UPI002953E6C3|nr:hypothetical protein [Rhodococcus oxybenzonivorans]MDV7357524.1 hypothetical protein [Rhodococcus oxybenzonivorans]